MYVYEREREREGGGARKNEREKGFIVELYINNKWNNWDSCTTHEDCYVTYYTRLGNISFSLYTCHTIYLTKECGLLFVDQM